MKQQRVSDLRKRLAKPEAYREHLLGAGYRAALLEIADSQLVQQSLSNEHYTPRCYLDAARGVLGRLPQVHRLKQRTPRSDLRIFRNGARRDNCRAARELVASAKLPPHHRERCLDVGRR